MGLSNSFTIPPLILDYSINKPWMEAVIAIVMSRDKPIHSASALDGLLSREL